MVNMAVPNPHAHTQSWATPPPKPGWMLGILSHSLSFVVIG